MSPRCDASPRRWAAAVLAACLATAVHAAPPPPAASADPHCGEARFLQENAAAMEKMMAAMHSAPKGDVDRDFVAMMVPHHQGAIDMAQLVLRYGRNRRIRRIAQEIIVTQQQEIVAMRMAVSDGVVPAPASVVARAHGLPVHRDGGANAALLENCP